MNQCTIIDATHVQYKGELHRIASKFGMSVAERLANPLHGVGCITDSGLRISIWDTAIYFQDLQEEPFMSIWTIYYDSRDFPGKYVARRHDIFRSKTEGMASDEYRVADSLDEIRSLIPFGLACLTRSDGDEPHIVETWL